MKLHYFKLLFVAVAIITALMTTQKSFGHLPDPNDPMGIGSTGGGPTNSQSSVSDCGANNESTKVDEEVCQSDSINQICFLNPILITTPLIEARCSEEKLKRYDEYMNLIDKDKFVSCTNKIIADIKSIRRVYYDSKKGIDMQSKGYCEISEIINQIDKKLKQLN